MSGKDRRPITLEQLLKKLQAYDSPNSNNRKKKDAILKKIASKLVAEGESAVPGLMDVLHRKNFPSFTHAAAALGEISDARAIKPLIAYLEDDGFGEDCKNALVTFGPACVPEIIKKVEYRISNPVDEKNVFLTLTNYPLSAIGEIISDESVDFLNRLLDDYMRAMPRKLFDPSKLDWPYRNVDLFHLLDCMVRQQDKRCIPHIKNAQACFPKENTEYLVCQIAIGRIKKGRVEGYLPLEALDITMPSSAIMNLFLGNEEESQDDFDEMYGEYFEDDED